jgi:hypothetical protein
MPCNGWEGDGVVKLQHITGAVCDLCGEAAEPNREVRPVAGFLADCIVHPQRGPATERPAAPSPRTPLHGLLWVTGRPGGGSGLPGSAARTLGQQQMRLLMGFLGAADDRCVQARSAGTRRSRRPLQGRWAGTTALPRRGCLGPCPRAHTTPRCLLLPALARARRSAARVLGGALL